MTASSSNNNCPEKNAKHDRKLRKPLIEKRRRERINCSLEQLKGIMVDAYNLDQSKLEKADVLEVTVQHMEGLQKGIGAGGVDSTASNNNNNSSTNGVAGLGLESRQRYSTGYIQCMHEVHNLLLSCPGMDKTLGAGLLNHLLQSLPHVSAADAAAAVAGGCGSPGSSPERGGCGAGYPRSDWSPPNGHYGGAVDAMGANNSNNNRRHHHSGSSQLSSSYSSSPPTSPLSPSPRTPFSRSPFRPRRLEMHEPPAMMTMMPPQAAAVARHHHQRRCPPQSPASLLLPPEVTTEGSSPPPSGEACAGVRDGSVLIVRPPVSSSSYGPCFTPPRHVSTPASPVAPAPSQVEDPSMWRPW